MSKVFLWPVDEAIVEMLLKMEEVCYSEGIGPDPTPLLEFIRKEFPELVNRYPYLFKKHEVKGVEYE